MSDVVLLEIVVQCNEVEADFLGNDVNAGTAGERRIHVHHAGVESVTGIGSHLMLRLQAVETLIPVAEGHEVGVSELAALGNARGAGGVEQDEQTVGSRLCAGVGVVLQLWDILREEYLALEFIDNWAQILVSNQQFCVGILHHEVESLLRITGV